MLANAPAEKVVRRVTEDDALRTEVLHRLTLQELAAGLNEEQAEQLRELLERKRRSGP